MELLLVVIALVSLALAATLSVVAWRLLREGRDRSAARVEALESLASRGDPAETELPLWDFAMRQQPATPTRPRRLLRSNRTTTPARVADASRLVASTASFGTTAAHESSDRRFAALAVVALVVAAGAGSVYALRSTETLSNLVAAAGSGRVNPSTTPPLELLSLRHHSQANGTFTVTGLVQNPVKGSSLSEIVAVVYLFDDEGRYFASGRASLDLDQFRPGEESPFVVTVPGGQGVSRYRVGFRLREGGVVAHVDRRGQSPGHTTGDALRGVGRAIASPPAPTAAGRTEG